VVVVFEFPEAAVDSELFEPVVVGVVPELHVTVVVECGSEPYGTVEEAVLGAA